MPKLTIVTGLPGSGKSCYINKHKGNCSGIIVHDYYKCSISGPPDRKSRHYDDLVNSLESEKDCIIADIVFCRQHERKKFTEKILAEISDITIEWIAFENDLDKCQNNIELRGRDNIEGKMEKAKELSDDFSYPKNAERKKVWSAN